jgi:hypothetical protein
MPKRNCPECGTSIKMPFLSRKFLCANCRSEFNLPTWYTCFEFFVFIALGYLFYILALGYNQAIFLFAIPASQALMLLASFKFGPIKKVNLSNAN